MSKFGSWTLDSIIKYIEDNFMRLDPILGRVKVKL